MADVILLLTKEEKQPDDLAETFRIHSLNAKRRRKSDDTGETHG
ncbi:MAG: hypothetical protein ACI4MP_00305 [Candidatus Ventricola sp.]